MVGEVTVIKLLRYVTSYFFKYIVTVSSLNRMVVGVHVAIITVLTWLPLLINILYPICMTFLLTFMETPSFPNLILKKDIIRYLCNRLMCLKQQ